MNNNEVKECEFYKKDYSCERCELGSILYKGKSNYKYHIDCRQNIDCYFKQRLQLKAENEQLKKEKDYHFKQSAMYLAQKTILGNANDTKLEIIQSLTQKLEKAREALNNITKSWSLYDDSIFLDIAQQALKELE